jgi:LPPG:FO 2-phospho-L-lactate transferase
MAVDAGTRSPYAGRCQDDRVQAVVLAGGVGGARFAAGVRDVIGRDRVTVIGNTGDDIVLHGLRICPDLDTVMYTLGGVASAERGWGRAGETFRTRAELAAYGSPDSWFALGDLDLATHLLRTQLLAAGQPLSAVTDRLCARFAPGVRLLPMTDDPVHTEVVGPDGRAMHFQDWWVRHGARPPVARFDLVGGEQARPGPGVLAAIETADVLLFAPSNPVVSIGPILAVPGVAAAVRARRGPVVGVSPIIGGQPVRGMADACLKAIGVDCDAAAVGRHYGARTSGGLLDGWLVDEADADAVPALADAGVKAAAVPLYLRDAPTTAALVRDALALAT